MNELVILSEAKDLLAPGDRAYRDRLNSRGCPVQAPLGRGFEGGEWVMATIS
jgi:hypothetical protein